MISTTQNMRDNNGLTGLPMNERRGIVVPTPENLQAVADNAAAKRAHEAQAFNMNANELGRSWGVSRDMILFLQRLEGKVVELEREVETLKRSASSPHLRDIERRG